MIKLIKFITMQVYTWEIGQPPALVPGMEKFSVRQISAGNFHVICSTDDGAVVTFGRNSSGQLVYLFLLFYYIYTLI